MLFAQQPFTAKLVLSNLEMYKYNWIWKKNKYANFLNIKHQPGKITEDICVFGKMACSPSKKGNMKYHPQMVEGKPYKNCGNGNRGASSSVRGNLEKMPIDNKGERYPTNILEFSLDTLNDFDREFAHPTRKPIDLLRHLIKTYTDEGDLVVDATCGVGSTGVAALLENRDYIGIEKDLDYFNKACQRIDKYKNLTKE